MICHPPIRQLRSTTPFIVRYTLPLLQCLEIRWFIVHFHVHPIKGFFVEAALTLFDLRTCLGEKAACDGAVCVQRHVEFAEEGNEFFVLKAGDGGVVALVDGWKDVVVLFAVVVDLAGLSRCEVGQTEAGEYAGLVGFVDAGEGGADGGLDVGGVEVEDVEL